MKILPGPFRKVLVCRTDALGDALLALPISLALKAAVPGIKISFLASAYTQEILANQPGVDQVLAYDALNLHHGRLRQRLAAEGFDAALLVFPDPRVSWAVFRARIPLRVGTGRRWWSFLYNLPIQHSRAQAMRHEADYNLDLVRALGLDVELQAPRLVLEPEAKLWAETYCQQAGLEAPGRWVIVHPGSRGSSPNWPASAYAALIRMLKKQNFQVLLTGSCQEQPLLRAIAEQSQVDPRCLTGTITLKQFAALISRTEVFVSGNTGPMHLAAGLGVPTVSFFPNQGVSGPIRWRPLSSSAIILTPAGSETLDRILPETVLEKILASIHDGSSPPSGQETPRMRGEE